MSRERIQQLAIAHGEQFDELLEQWSERAAVREFSGGMPRAEAEAGAYDDVVAMLGEARRGPRSAAASVDHAADRRRTR
jgi:hypothetical protein